jgi:hypothetical protein
VGAFVARYLEQQPVAEPVAPSAAAV